MDVSIIIVNYNTEQITLNCLESIYYQTNGVKFEIIVIDNASNDNSCQRIQDKFPQIILYKNTHNVGFGRANNIGIDHAKGKYLFFLNSDTILLNNAIKLFFDYMENNNYDKIGAIGCVMLDKNNNLNNRNSYYYFPNILLTYKNILCIGANKLNKKFVLDNNQIKKEGKLSVDFIVGADLFIPKTIIDCIGKFDPDYFLYWEEVDLQYRMFKQNYVRLIIYGPQIIHLEGGSSSKIVKNWQRITETKSLMIYYRKHKSFFNLLFLKFYFVENIFISTLKRKYTLKEQIEFLKILF